MKLKQLIIVFLSLCTGFSRAQVNLTQSLSACYALNGNASEPVNSLTGTLSAAVTATVDRFSNANSALYFSGSSSSYVELPNSALLKPNSITFSGWVKTNALTSQYIAFAHNGCSGFFEGYAFAIHNPGTGYRFHLVKSNTCSSSAQIALNSNQLVATQTWYHVGFYAGPDSLKIYVNGSLDVSLAYASTLSYASTAKVYLGGTNLSTNLPFNGTLDNVRFYNRKLTNAEMQQLYTLDPSCTGPAAPYAAFSVSSPTVCTAKTLTLTDQSNNTPTAWNWQTPGASTSSFSTSNPTLSFPNPGTYTISLVSSNTVGVSNTATQVITVLASPTLAVSNSVVCIGQNATLTASGASSYSWNTGQTGPTLVVGPGINSSYTVVGTGTNMCTTSSQINMTVVPLPTVSISGSTIVCPGQSTTFTANGAQTYTWNTGFVGSQLSVTPLAPGGYTVTGTDVNGCVNSTARSVSIHVLPSLSVSGNGTVCEGSPTSLLAGGSAISFTWSNGVVGNLVTVSPTISTIYTVTGMGVNGCLNTATQLVFVNSLPSILINANNTSVCQGDGVILTASGASTYSWSGAVVNNTMFYPSTSATYSVSGTGTNGCKNTATIQIVVQPLPTVNIVSSPSAPVCSGETVTLTASGANIYSWSTGSVTPFAVVAPSVTTQYQVTGTDANGCDATAVFTQTVNTCLGISTVRAESDFYIFPNPTKGKVYLQSTRGTVKRFELTNNLGAVILTGETNPSVNTSIDLSNYPNGIYFIKTETQGAAKSTKIIKE